jgi:hypothetical protein
LTLRITFAQSSSVSFVLLVLLVVLPRQRNAGGVFRFYEGPCAVLFSPVAQTGSQKRPSDLNLMAFRFSNTGIEPAMPLQRHQDTMAASPLAVGGIFNEKPDPFPSQA